MGLIKLYVGMVLVDLRVDKGKPLQISPKRVPLA